MSVNRLEVLDLVIGVLREHERKLDAAVGRAEELATQLAKVLNTCKATGVSDPK